MEDIDSAATTIDQNNNLMDIDSLMETTHAADKKNNNDNSLTWLTRELNSQDFKKITFCQKILHISTFVEEDSWKKQWWLMRRWAYSIMRLGFQMVQCLDPLIAKSCGQNGARLQLGLFGVGIDSIEELFESLADMLTKMGVANSRAPLSCSKARVDLKILMMSHTPMQMS
uniref:Uncharacterized protein n=1 Tax=Romanomermis culicivorax TaxID=13658 RepID=A0A915KK57_ROMCU